METPIKIDLNDWIDTNESAKLWLSADQLTSFNKFLEKKQKEEKLWIIYLTKEELKQFKETLSSTNPQDEFDFIEEQARETITSSELFKWSELGRKPESLSWYDEFSYNIFFWKEWILKNLSSLTEDAKRNFTTWFNLFLLEYTKQNLSSLKEIKGWLSEDNIQIIINKYLKISWWEILIKGNLSKDSPINSLLNLSKLTIITDINYSENGENNEIFMNPIKAKEFFKKVMDWTNAQDLIDEAEQREKIQVQITDKEKQTIKELWDSISIKWWSTLWIIDQLSQNKEEAGKAINELLWDSHPSVIEFLKDDNFFSNFIRKILEMFDIDLDTAFNKSVVNKIRERFTEQIQENEFNDLIIKKDSLDDSFYENLDNNKWWWLTSIKKIAKLQWQKVYSKKFLLSLFSKEWVLKGKNIIKTDWKLDYEKFINSINEVIKAEEEKAKSQEKKEKTDTATATKKNKKATTT